MLNGLEIRSEISMKNTHLHNTVYDSENLEEIVVATLFDWNPNNITRGQKNETRNERSPQRAFKHFTC